MRTAFTRSRPRRYNGETCGEDTEHGGWPGRTGVAVAAHVAPAAVLLGATVVLAWRGGSISAASWLPAAALAALVLVTVLASRAAVAPGRLALCGLAALAGLAAWAAVSITRSPSPSGARDEALLTALYVVALAVALLVPARRGERLRTLELVVLALGGLAIATAIELVAAPGPALAYGGRLNFPISYVNAASALFVLAFWPAVVVAARREAPPAVRAAALAAASATLAAAVIAQSKGSAIGLAVSAVAMLAFVPGRLRLLAALAVPVALAAALFVPLTRPYGAESTAALDASLRTSGVAVLASAAAGFAAGALLALADRRLGLRERTRRRIGGGLLAALCVALVAAVAVFLVRVDHPGGWAADRWHSFKHTSNGAGSTHLLALGSNRYDFWRVSLKDFERHPVAGVGARGFYSEYLQQRRSSESPLRAHSIYFDLLGELGIVGLVLFALAVGLPLVAIARRLADPVAAGAFGAAAYFLVHAGVDWLWTFPALGIPFFLLLGAGAAGGSRRALAPRVSLAGAAAALLLALLAFAPPWISSRFTSRAYADPAGAAADLRWARRLDPLSLDPFFARWRLASTPAARIDALEPARRVEPRSVAVLYQLGLAYLAAGRAADARATLAEALRLDPHERAVAVALRASR